MMGGAGKIMAKGQELYDQGKYRLAHGDRSTSWSMPSRATRRRKDLLADIFEQIGYQNESPSVRNSFLAAAYELRDGVMPHGGPGRGRTRSRHEHRAVARLPGHPARQPQGRGAEVQDQPVTPDNGEKFVVEMSNATLTAISGYQASDADLTITINRSDLEQVMLGRPP